MKATYRTIRKEDFDKCAEGLVAAYKGAPWYNEWTFQEALLRIESTMSGLNARGFVAELDDEVIAMCLGRIDYYNNNWTQFCIDEFNLRPEYHNKGIGSDFMKFVEVSMRKQNVARIFLITGGELAAKFYKKNGFEVGTDGTMLTLNL